MHNYQACTLESRNYNLGSTCHSYLSLGALEPVLRSKRSHRKEKPMLTATGEKPAQQRSPGTAKTNTFFNKL